MNRFSHGAVGAWVLAVSLGAFALPHVAMSEEIAVLEDEHAGMRFRQVPAGIATLGSPDDEAGRRSGETIRTVRVSRAFWLGETEVTQRQWSRVMPGRPSYFDSCGGNCPVERVSWFEAVRFANRLSKRSGLERCYRLEKCTGRAGAGCPEDSARKCDGDFTCRVVTSVGSGCLGYRLPTSAEWEWAARAGSRTAIYTGDLSILSPNHAPALDAIAWYGGNSGVDYAGAQECAGWAPQQHPAERCGTHPVAQKKPNRWGLHDMIGNVWEWLEDRIDWDMVSRSLVSTADREGGVDPVGNIGATREMRGGSWYNFADACRAAQRGSSPPSMRVRTVGFRLARSIPQTIETADP